MVTAGHDPWLSDPKGQCVELELEEGAEVAEALAEVSHAMKLLLSNLGSMIALKPESALRLLRIPFSASFVPPSVENGMEQSACHRKTTTG